MCQFQSILRLYHLPNSFILLLDESNLDASKGKESFKKEIRRGRIVRISTKDTVVLQTTKSTENPGQGSEIQDNKEEMPTEIVAGMLFVCLF